MSESITGELIKSILPPEMGGKPLIPEARTEPSPPTSEKTISNEQLAALTKTHAQKDQVKLQAVRTVLKSEVEQEQRKREEQEAWEMYTRTYEEQNGKPPPTRDTERGNGLFATYVEQTYKPYKEATKKAIDAASAYDEVKHQSGFASPQRQEAWQTWVKASREMHSIENSRAYQDKLTHDFNKQRAASERDRYGDYLSSVFSTRSEKAAAPAHRTSQAPARTGAPTATATSSVSRLSEAASSRRSDSGTSSRGSSASTGSRSAGKAA